MGQEELIIPGEFDRDIKPIFDKYCLECHGPDKAEGDFRIDDYLALLDEEDEYVIPGDANKSLMYEMLISTDPEFLMPPPDHGPRLTQGEVALVKIWIDAGAKFPEKKDGDAAKSEPEPKPEETTWIRFWKSVGDFHPATVHFPIALLIVGALFALISFRGSYTCADCAYYCLWIAALSGIVACFVGWSYAWIEGHNGDIYAADERIFWHRWTGVGCTVLSLLLALYAAYSRSRNPDDGVLWRLGILVLAALVGYVGHEGGELTHRRGYRMFYEFIGIEDAKKDAEPKPQDESGEDKNGEGDESGADGDKQVQPADG